MYKALAARDLAGHSKELIAAYTDLQGRVPATRFWSSVFDQARFVLRRYSVAASEEKAAAQTLLMQLNRWRVADTRPRRGQGAGAN